SVRAAGDDHMAVQLPAAGLILHEEAGHIPGVARVLRVGDGTKSRGKAVPAGDSVDIKVRIRASGQGEVVPTENVIGAGGRALVDELDGRECARVADRVQIQRHSRYK